MDTPMNHRNRKTGSFNLIRQKSSTSKVWDEGGSGEFTIVEGNVLVKKLLLADDRRCSY